MQNYIILIIGILFGMLLTKPTAALGQLTSTDGYSYVQDIKGSRHYDAPHLNPEKRTVQTPDITVQGSDRQMQGVYFLIRSQRQDIEVLKAMVLRQEDIIAELKTALEEVLKKDSN